MSSPNFQTILALAGAVADQVGPLWHVSYLLEHGEAAELPSGVGLETMQAAVQKVKGEADSLAGKLAERAAAERQAKADAELGVAAYQAGRAVLEHDGAL